MTANHIKEKFQEILNSLYTDFEVIVASVEDIDGEGWMIAYNGKEFLEKGTPATMLLGNNPVIVDLDGNLFETGYGESEEEDIQLFRDGKLPKWWDKTLEQ